ncbi:baseplate multidomain protein megatron [Gemmobacter serpentinus]|uniref:baseplate multidomain protein megatron n=1 Tax=Gemmobacter serpentinus TaxID=2652247 RepID=UPI00124DE085|nr:glycoside hydrolase TIM-barrel-like domain-containing protein [Gemmobacter serpentinus]
MATILLSAAGSAIGAGFGGTVLGLSGAVIGRAVGATIGRAIDQRVLGGGSDAVEIGRVERFRLMGASEGAAVGRVWGRMRVAGQVIWASRFEETVSTSGGGKGAPKGPATTTYSYSVSLAVALCEGRISGIERIWADGTEIAPNTLNLRIYTGSETQLPDPKIAAVQGVDQAPAYRGIAYVVIEGLDLGRFGNRVPQFSFEVIRPAQGHLANGMTDLRDAVRAVALIPGTGEFSLSSTKVHYAQGDEVLRSANVHTPQERTDMAVSMHQLGVELPDCGSVSLVVSWFGTDLRCGQCEVRPKVEQKDDEAAPQIWRAGGIGRAEAQEVPRVSGHSVYGGTPSDASVIEAIRSLRAQGRAVMFYPFILMDQLAGNGLANPWTGAASQPALPWRGRITLEKAPGQTGTTDRTAAATAEVAAFFGTAAPADFGLSGETVSYSGPDEWKFRRFVLHYAHLCAAAGGVDAFCVGSEMVGLTTIRGAGDSFPAVTALRQLAAEVRAILGPATKISYAADWTEYFGYHTGPHVYFHLDPFWADENVDFIGIDNYMPLSDWRDGDDHADAGWGSIHNLDYLKANVEGGEGYAWYYDSPEGEASQRRKSITDGAYDEPWVFRYKDIRAWWSHRHFDRPGGARAAFPTAWVPQSKPVWFTEYGCAALDKGANQPNKFLDPKSSESLLPKYSSGRRDDLMQFQYLIAMHDHWTLPENNPVSPIYGGPMIDWSRAHVWAWDARPFPAFPNEGGIWSDGDNYQRGHWLTGRASHQSLAAVVAEICEAAGMTRIDVSDLRGVVRGFMLDQLGSARSALQVLMLAYGFEAVEREGKLIFLMRDGQADADLSLDQLAISDELPGRIEMLRSPDGDLSGRVLIGHYLAEADFEIRVSETRMPEDTAPSVSQTDLPLLLTAAEGVSIAERWLTEARVSRDTARFALPRSLSHLGAGDVVRIGQDRYRLDRVDLGDVMLAEATRTEPGVYRPSDFVEVPVPPRGYVPELPVYPVFLDLPLMTGDEVPHAPHIAIAARPWRGQVGLWSSDSDEDYKLNRNIVVGSTVGRSQTVLRSADPGLWDRGEPLRIRLSSGTLSSASPRAVLNGANAMAIGNPETGHWEVFQFCTANLVAPQLWEVSHRLRGQAGTDAIMPALWPEGSQIVLLDRSLTQVDLAASARGLSRHYRVGLASKGYDDAAVLHSERSFDGVGLRPYAPVHLKASRQPDGDLRFTWIRRSRIDGDSWQSREVPLGEEREEYHVQIHKDATLLREAEISAPAWTWTAAQQSGDGGFGEVTFSVAQISDRYGPGPMRRLVLDL